MPARFTVRRVRPKELDRIAGIEAASFGPDAYDRNLFAAYLRRCGDLFLGAAGPDGLCGYLIVCLRGERAELVSIAVDPAERGRGAASALLQSALRRLRRRGVARLALMVKAGNAAAYACYVKFGFKQVRRVPRYYEDGSDGYLLSLSLQSEP